MIETSNLERLERLTFRMPGSKSLRIPFIKIPKASNPVSSTLLLVIGFSALIIAGSILLMLPISSRAGIFTGPVTAFFSAVSAACVTGLVVVDTGTYWSIFGQGVLLALFQIGGLGFISAATLLLLTINRKFGLKERLAVSQTLGIDRLGGTLGVVATVALFSVVLEAIGATIFYFHWSATNAVDRPLWPAIFQAVSAFNNCGMDLLGNFKSLTNFQNDYITLGVTAVLVIIGSTGYIVFTDVFRNRKFSHLALESKMVLIMTLILLVTGTLLIFGLEYTNSASLGMLTWPHQFMVAFFEAVSPRTAGFSAVDVGNLKQVTLFVVIILMFIGGAVGSTAGGIKVNTLSVLTLTVRSLFRGSGTVEAFDRQLTEETVHRATALFLLYLAAAAAVILALSVTEIFPFYKIFFETFSALSTVGLSTGITPSLSLAGKIVIMVAMFAGRIGPLALIAFMAHRHRPAAMEYPHESIRLG